MSVTKRYVKTADFPTSPDIAQNINRVDTEIHPFPDTSDDGSRYIVPPYSVLCAFTEETDDDMEDAIQYVSDKQLLEGVVTHTFANFSDLNFTTGDLEHKANRRRLRFFGVAGAGGMLMGDDAKEFPVDVGRLAASVSGLTPVFNDMTYLADAIPGDYVEIIFVDSGGRWTEQNKNGYGTPILRTVKAAQFDNRALTGPAFGRDYHDDDSGDLSLLHTAAYQCMAKGAREGADGVAVAAAMASFSHKRPEASLGVSDFNGAYDASISKLKKLAVLSTPVTRLLAAAAGIKETGITNTATATLDFPINPFMRLPAGGSLNVIADAFLYGTPTIPSLIDHIYRAYDPNDDGKNWNIPSTAPLFMRITRHVSAGTIEAAKVVEERVTKELEAEKIGLGGEWETAQIRKAGMSHLDYVVALEIKRSGSNPTMKDFQSLVKEAENINPSPSVGASLDLIEAQLKPFCKICMNKESTDGGMKITADAYGYSAFGEHWDQFTEADRKKIIDTVFTDVEGYNPWFIMRLVRAHFGKNPMYFEHPHTRGYQRTGDIHHYNVNVKGITFSASEYLGTNLSNASALEVRTGEAAKARSPTGADIDTAAHVMIEHHIATSAHPGDDDVEMDGLSSNLTDVSDAKEVKDQLKIIPVKPSRIIGMFMGKSVYEDAFVLNLDRRPVGFF